ncbi:PE domain-containing protein [Mycolicibacter sp. MYC123]|uniref:PE domain-containing protein n=1 Tax=[Mycobacterium] zoologicum TaxID=2872311 RepID=A0ABU5YJ56_9MYCO|nr:MULTISPECIES: PE domain-containing protein [unclassified Mycolicibacter]MEB3049905.1 PE domain-containing protein [Mycolicibacter sp. MYC123]MEB3063233.1 PE domain-containing protein [Mycolicibacter sp. MYC101]
MLSVEPEAVLASAGAESAISAETAAAASAASPGLLGVLPMGNDLDSIAFHAALLAAGTEYLGIVAEHSAQRGLFAGTQATAAGVYSATEALRAATAAISG